MKIIKHYIFMLAKLYKIKIKKKVNSLLIIKKNFIKCAEFTNLSIFVAVVV